MNRITRWLVNAVLNHHLSIDVLAWYLHTFIGYTEHVENILLCVDDCL